jgi:hypothetical protein
LTDIDDLSKIMKKLDVQVSYPNFNIEPDVPTLISSPFRTLHPLVAACLTLLKLNYFL